MSSFLLFFIVLNLLCCFCQYLNNNQLVTNIPTRTDTQNIIVYNNNVTIQCSDLYKNCNITCINSSCINSNLLCSPFSYNCSINCISYYSCSLTNINVYSRNNVHLICSGNQSCSHINLYGNNVTKLIASCVNNSCTDSILYLSSSDNILWYCYDQSCQFNLFYLISSSFFNLFCFGNSNNNSPCWMIDINAYNTEYINISCINSYSCNTISINSTYTSLVQILSIGYNSLINLNIHYPSQQTLINITCISDIKYGCSKLNIITDQNSVYDAIINCVGYGCGGSNKIVSRNGLNNINFTLTPTSLCICNSIEDCIGTGNDVFVSDLIWSIDCAPYSECNYTGELYTSTSNKYNQLQCQSINEECFSSNTTYCINQCINENKFKLNCCNNIYNQLYNSFNKYQLLYNCTTPNNNNNNNKDWYYPVALVLCSFVIVCLVLIWCKNSYKKKKEKAYKTRILKKHNHVNVISSSINGPETTVTESNRKGHIVTSSYIEYDNKQ